MRTFLRILLARLKDKLVQKVQVPCTAPAPCPKCGSHLEVPLIRTPMKLKCPMCSEALTVMAIGLVNTDEEKLKEVYSEVTMWVNMSNADEDSRRLH